MSGITIKVKGETKRLLDLVKKMITKAMTSLFVI